jgi:hypothetical protein
MSTGNPFTADEDAYMVAHKGDGTASIALALNRDRSSVHGRMKRLGLTWAVRDRITWTPELDAALADLCAQRLPDTAIAARIGCSEAGVRMRRDMLGIVKRAPPRSNGKRALRHRREAALDELRPVAVLTPEEMSRDQRFVERLLADGGMPRALEVRPGVTVWVGPDNRLWRGLTRRIAA